MYSATRSPRSLTSSDGHPQPVANSPLLPGGGLVSAALEPLHGPDAVARFLLGVFERQPDLIIREELVNGEPGLVTTDAHDHTLAVLALAANDDGKIKQGWAIRNPQKLEAWA